MIRLVGASARGWTIGCFVPLAPLGYWYMVPKLRGRRGSANGVLGAVDAAYRLVLFWSSEIISRTEWRPLQLF